MDVNKILIKFFGGKASKVEVEQLEKWKFETLGNLEKMKEMKEIWDASEGMNGWDDINLEEAWNNIDAKIEHSTPSQPNHEAKRFSLGSNILKIAAIGILLVFAKFAYDNSTVSKQDEISFVGHYYAEDAKKEITLPDGSFVVLTPNSSVDIQKDFMNNRDVFLKGNAFFKVARDEKSPFVLHTGKGDVKVLGTEFSVLNNDGIFELFVNEGKVSYSYSNRSIILEKDDFAILDGDNIIKSKMFDNNYLSWKTDKLIFRNAQWIDVFKDLNRHYKTSFDFKNVKESDCKLNTIFNNESLEDVLKELELLWNLKYDKMEGSIIKVKSIDC